MSSASILPGWFARAIERLQADAVLRVAVCGRLQRAQNPVLDKNLRQSQQDAAIPRGACG